MPASFITWLTVVLSFDLLQSKDLLLIEVIHAHAHAQISTLLPLHGTVGRAEMPCGLWFNYPVELSTLDPRVSVVGDKGLACEIKIALRAHTLPTDSLCRSVFDLLIGVYGEHALHKGLSPPTLNRCEILIVP